MDFFDIGPSELLFVIVIALLVLGPNQMVDAARKLGKYVRDLQRAASEVPRMISLDEEPPPSLPPRQSVSGEPTAQQLDEEQDSPPEK